MDNNIPDKNSYTNMVNRIRDVFKNTMPKLATSVGSAVYELIIRPLSIIYATIEDSLYTSIRSKSLSSLKDSPNTTVGDVDHILSNYFVTRNESRPSKGTITIESSSAVSRVPSGARFQAVGVDLFTDIDTVGIYPDTEGYTNDDDVSYAQARKIGDNYYFTVSVETDNSDAIINAGTPVDIVEPIPYVTSAVVSSAVSGGSRGETDAEMIERARTNMCSWYGGPKSIHKILSGSGVPVYSSMAFDSADPEMNRVLDSPVLVGTGGMIDVYVKTAHTPMSMTVVVNMSKDEPCDISGLVPAGVLAVTSVVDTHTNMAMDFSVIWGSSHRNITDRGARLSSYQTVTVTTGLTSSYAITVEYMPGIQELQTYIDRADVRMLGNSILVKAAIPTYVRVDAVCVTGGNDIMDIRNTVKDHINNLPVGTSHIDIADAQKSLSTMFPGAYIKNPVSIKTSTVTYMGYKVLVGSTMSGVIDSIGTDDSLTGRVRFFCISDQEVCIE